MRILSATYIAVILSERISETSDRRGTTIIPQVCEL